VALCLGTAQLGQRYVIRKPDKGTAFDILSSAVECHYDYVDTAPFYGDSESLIGEFTRTNRVHFKVITKIPKFTGTDGKSFVDWCKMSVTNSMRALGIGQLWGVLLHDVSNALDFPQETMGLRTWIMITGVAQRFGISFYDPNEVTHRMMGIYQIPMSMMDTRFYRDLPREDFFWNGNMIMVRSVYLKGKIEDREKAMRFVKTAIEGRTRNNLIVVGAETPEQVKENAKNYDKPLMGPKEFEELLKESEKVTAEVNDPRRWK
jgi:aryl-alcohol dehydrogenase-like predicted oxidoreductase